MVHGYLPVYYHYYDFLHGSKSLFFDWFTGTGVNMTGIASANGLLCPSNLILLLFPRDKLLYGMSALLVFKIFLAGVSAQWFFMKRFPSVSFYTQTLASSMYALSGFCIYYYFHLIWLDVVILFPLVVYAAETLFRKGKILPLTAALFGCLVSSFYMGMMVVICLFFTGGLYIFVFTEKDERKYAVTRLGISTFLALALSLFINLPAYLQMSGSSRYGSSFSDFFGQTMGFSFDRDKAALFLCLQTAAFFLTALAAKYRTCKKEAAFCIGAAAYTFLPYIIEGADLLWHFGSYKSFPMRFAFMSIFYIILAFVVYVDRFGEEVLKPFSGKNKVAAYALSAVCFAAWFLYIRFMCGKLGTKFIGDDRDKTSFVLALGSYALGFAVMAVFSKMPSLNARRYATAAFCLVEVFLFAAASIGEVSQMRVYRAEYNTAYVGRTTEAAGYFDEESGVLDRVKNTDMSLNVNYPFILRRAAVNNWTHQIPSRLQDAAEMLGYSTTYTLLLDTGGTSFGEALLGTKQEIAMNSDGSFGVSDCRYTLPSGFATDADLSGFGISDSRPGIKNVFVYQNGLYRALSGDGGDLFDIAEEPAEADARELRYEFDLSEKSEIYLAAGKVRDDSFTVTVNGKTAGIPTYFREDNALFPREYYEGVLPLGEYSGKVSVTLAFGGKASADNISFGVCGSAKFAELCGKINSENEISYTSGKRSLSFDITKHEGNTLFVPVCYDEGWSCRVDGAETAISCVLGSFMAVEIPDGACTAEFSFTPKGMKTGVLCSVFALLLAAAAVLLNRKKLLEKMPAFVTGFVEYIFMFVFAAATAAVYLGPLVIGVFYG